MDFDKQTPLLAAVPDAKQDRDRSLSDSVGSLGKMEGRRKASNIFFPDTNADEAQGLRWELAAIYLHDSQHGRRPNLHLQHPATLYGYTPLQVYRLTHKRSYRYAILSVIYVHLLLALFEYPALIDTKHPTAWTVIIEMICLAVYLLDMYIRNFCHETGDRQERLWSRTKLVLIGLVAFEGFIVLMVYASGTRIIRLTRIFRPFFLIERGRQLRKLALAIVSTLPKIVDVCILITLHILFFGFAGFILFTDKGGGWAPNPNFSSLEDSFLSLLILLTTANYPDVMMESYARSNWTALYFIAFLGFGLYFLMNLILAVVYNNFKERTKMMADEIIAGQCEALCASFDMLADNEGAPLDKRHISIRDWMDFMKYYHERSKLRFKPHHCVIQFHALDLQHRGRLDLEDWRHLPEFLDLRIKGDKASSKEYTLADLSSTDSVTVMDKMKTSQKILKTWLNKPYADMFWDSFVVMNAIVIVLQLDLEKHSTDKFIGNATYNDTNIFFLSIFIIEAGIKIFALGLLKYLHSDFNKIDVIVITISFLGEVVPGLSSLQTFTLFRLLRMTRIMRSLKRFHIYFATIKQISGALVGLIGILICVYYSFSIVGMEALNGRIHKDEVCLPTTSITDACVANDHDLFAKLNKDGFILGGGVGYWENNFNDLPHSMVTLWELMVVNNWFITMNGFADVTNRWTRLYFVAFFFVTVMVVLNCVVAFIVEAFQAQYSRFESGEDVKLRDKILNIAKAIAVVICEHMDLSPPRFADEDSTEKRDVDNKEQQEEYIKHFRKNIKLYLEYNIKYHHIDLWRVRRRRRTPDLYMAMFEAELNEEDKLNIRKVWRNRPQFERTLVEKRAEVLDERERIKQRRFSMI